MDKPNEQSNEMPDELEREEDEARELDQSTTERGDHSSFRPFEVQSLGGRVIRHRPEGQGEDQSGMDTRVEYIDDQGNTLGFGDADEQPDEEYDIRLVDVEDIDDLDDDDEA